MVLLFSVPLFYFSRTGAPPPPRIISASQEKLPSFVFDGGACTRDLSYIDWILSCAMRCDRAIVSCAGDGWVALWGTDSKQFFCKSCGVKFFSSQHTNIVVRTYINN